MTKDEIEFAENGDGMMYETIEEQRQEIESLTKDAQGLKKEIVNRDCKIVELEDENKCLKEREDENKCLKEREDENKCLKEREEKAKEIIRELSKSLFLAKGLIRDLCDDTVDFRESKERALYCYDQEHLDGYKKAEAFLKED